LGCAVIAVAFLSVTVVKRDRGIRRLNVELDQRVKDRTAKLETETAEKRTLHDQLLQAQKLDAVGTMASGIAHDFNNSLAAITGFAEVAKTKPSDSGEFIDHILMAAKQAAGTTKSLLTFSKESPTEKVPRDVVQLVRETTGFLRKMLPTSIEIAAAEPEDEAIWCPLDSVHIQQVLVNVAMNARDAMPDGGVISISIGAHADRPGFARLLISDDGAGMPPEVRNRIFDPFFTTKSRGQGTGLGMSIVHGIVEAHRGSIEIESAVGRGTNVSILLPQCPPQASVSVPPEPVLGGHGETILVAEDRQDVQAMIVAQLKTAGFEVLIASDGQQALNVLQEQGSKVSLALLDVDLPIIDGKECLRKIAMKYPQLPTILMSGLSSVDPAQLATPFLRKPFDRRTLLATINHSLYSESDEQASGVLVIDDDDLVRLSTKAVLASSDVDVYLANDGPEAVSQLRNNVNRIGTVLLDWNLPQTDPEAVLQELRHVSPNVKVIIVSGDLRLQSRQVQAKGFSQLLRKPVSSSELIEAVA
jgi:two-component system cell cycle sensor histidine kinase/response regulator CckA